MAPNADAEQSAPVTKGEPQDLGIPKFTHNIQKEFTRVESQQPHCKRRKAMLAAHPELANLNAPEHSSALWTLILVAFLYWSAYTLKDSSWWIILTIAYTFGATADHALWCLIHDYGHESAFYTGWLNSVFLLITNMPHVFPSGVTFTYYHRQHHIHLNETYEDPDIPGPLEQKIFGTTSIGKICYLACFPLVQVFRTVRYGPMYCDKWVVLNYLINIPVNLSVLYFWGPSAFLYLCGSFFFSIGLHPLGGRWIAEHYAVRAEQETYSYYGPINNAAFNIGYHNEHHDLPRVPWSRLPTVHKIAKEFYKPLYSHPSYTGLLVEFFFNPNFTLTTRVVRENKKAEQFNVDIFHVRDLGDDSKKTL